MPKITHTKLSSTLTFRVITIPSHAEQEQIRVYSYRLFLLLLLILSSFQSLWAQQNMNWRFWRASDGLKESYTPFISFSENRNVWINHGDVREMSWYDGYKINRIKSPGSFLHVYEDVQGHIWAQHHDGSWNWNGIQKYMKDQDHWEFYSIEALKDTKIDDISHSVKIAGIDENSYLLPFLPYKEDQFIFLLPDRLIGFNAKTKMSSEIQSATNTRLGRFLEIAKNSKGGFWLTGEKGIARLDIDLQEKEKCTNYIESILDKEWNIKDLHSPIESKSGELFVVGHKIEKTRKILLRFQDENWERIYPADDNSNINIIAGWRGDQDCIWVMSKNELMRLYPKRDGTGYDVNMIPGEGVLSGKFLDVSIESERKFWISTSLGIARCSPSIWSAPKEIKEIRSNINSIFEDNEGKLWFSCGNLLETYQNGKWETIQLEDDIETKSFQTDSIVQLPNNRIAIGTNAKDYLQLFDSKTHKSEHVKAVSETIGLIAPRKNQTCWIQFKREDYYKHFRIEYYDGTQFHPFLDKGSDWKIGELRCIYEDEDGNVWFGGTGEDGLAVYRSNEQYQTFGHIDEIKDGGVLSILQLHDGKIWFGGRDKISKYDGKKWSEVESEYESFDQVRSMTQGQDGTIWIASGSGLHRYSEGSWDTFNQEDGLPSSYVNDVLIDRTGDIWACTTKGIGKFDTTADQDPPKAIIDPKNVREIASGGEVNFNYSGTDKWNYTTSNRLYYSYRIDDASWSQFKDDTVAKCSNLTPGDHCFQVRAMDRNWNKSEPESWNFTVDLPWYLDYRIITILLLAILSVSYAFNRHFKLRLSYKTLRQTQNQLIQSGKMASLGQLVAGVAHEINNPINFIKSNIQPLKEYMHGLCNLVNTVREDKKHFPESIRMHYESIFEEADLDFVTQDSDKIFQSFEEGSLRIANIVSDLRQYIRIDQTHQSSYDIHNAIDSTLSFLENQCRDRITIHKYYSDIPKITCSPGQINQVFMNVLKNTIEFIEDKGNIWIYTRMENEHVIIHIQDDGKGIPQVNLSKVFDPFFTTKPVGSGTGLGLSLSYSIIEQHGGTITVESEEKNGTTFTVKLPIKKDAWTKRLRRRVSYAEFSS